MPVSLKYWHFAFQEVIKMAYCLAVALYTETP